LYLINYIHRISFYYKYNSTEVKIKKRGKISLPSIYFIQIKD